MIMQILLYRKLEFLVFQIVLNMELHAIWLDLDNAYGSVKNVLIENIWITEDYQKSYIYLLTLNFSTKDFTEWQKLISALWDIM